tara:strand:+ start:289 stop:1863 length:1575 start_codon:yes stop_codon:yes gene_type:complete
MEKVVKIMEWSAKQGADAHRGIIDGLAQQLEIINKAMDEEIARAQAKIKEISDKETADLLSCKSTALSTFASRQRAADTEVEAWLIPAVWMVGSGALTGVVGVGIVESAAASVGYVCDYIRNTASLAWGCFNAVPKYTVHSLLGSFWPDATPVCGFGDIVSGRWIMHEGGLDETKAMGMYSAGPTGIHNRTREIPGGAEDCSMCRGPAWFSSARGCCESTAGGVAATTWQCVGIWPERYDGSMNISTHALLASCCVGTGALCCCGIWGCATRRTNFRNWRAQVGTAVTGAAVPILGPLAAAVSEIGMLVDPNQKTKDELGNYRARTLAPAQLSMEIMPEIAARYVVPGDATSDVLRAEGTALPLPTQISSDEFVAWQAKKHERDGARITAQLSIRGLQQAIASARERQYEKQRSIQEQHSEEVKSYIERKRLEMATMEQRIHDLIEHAGDAQIRLGLARSALMDAEMSRRMSEFVLESGDIDAIIETQTRLLKDLADRLNATSKLLNETPATVDEALVSHKKKE